VTGTVPHLSPTERRVVARIAQGDTYQQIADRLGISPETVATHRRNAGLRLHARNTVHLIALAIGYRLIPANTATRGASDGAPTHP
jgi:DNA-binding CsgD family transcriptional regulator